jgi:hypothetical protein
VKRAGGIVIRGAVLAWAALAFILPSDALALTIQGRVLRGEERAPAPGIPVSLHIVKGEEELPGQTMTSGARGAFRFDDVRSEPGLSYYVSTEYKGAYYTEGPIEVHPPGSPHEAAAGSTVSQDLVIYEVGREMGSVRVTNHHVVVERNPDHLHVTEILIFQNDGSTAYLGTGLNHAENAGVRLGLPASVENFEPGVGGDAQTVRVQGRDLTGVRPIPPGTRPFSFSYHVPLSGRMDLSHRLYFPTDKVVVLLNDPSLKLESNGTLRYSGSRDQGGKKFEVYEASMVPLGAEIEMRVHGASFWSNPKIIPWLAAPFVIAAVLIVAAKRGRQAKDSGVKGSAGPLAGHGPVPVATPEPLRVHAPAGGPHGVAQARLAPHAGSEGEDLATVYLFLIDALDRGLEQGEYSKESHALIRGNLKRRLETILSNQPQARVR